MAISVQQEYQSPLATLKQLPAGLHERLASAIDAACEFKVSASVQLMSVFDKTGWQVWAGLGFANYAEVYAFEQPRMTLSAAYFFYRGETAPTALTFNSQITLEQSIEFERVLGLNIDARKSIDGIPLGTVNSIPLRKVRYPKYNNPETVYMGLPECRL